jgi:ribosomal protein S18 acetylase RimI-like enzyme
MNECLLRAGRISGLEQVHLAVVTSNETAVNLYIALGFRTYGTDPGALKVGTALFDEYLMVKELRDIDPLVQAAFPRLS